MSEDPPGETRWATVAVAVAAGVMAAVQVGKVPPAIPALREGLGVDLVTAGWIASVFNVVTALFGVVGGVAADRIGPREALIGGTGLMALGGLLGGAADGAGGLLASRALAVVGFVAVVVAAPRLIVIATRPRDQALALGTWSVYMPAGMALGMVTTPVMLHLSGWRGAWLVHGCAMLVFLGLLALSTRGVAGAGGGSPRDHGTHLLSDLRRTAERPGPWLLGACFACYTVQYFALTAWMPTFLVETQGRSVTAAGLLGAAVVAANILGNLGGAWALHRGVGRWWLQIGALMVMAMCAAAIFSPVASAAWKVPLAMVFTAAGGLLPAAVLAAAAVHAPSPAQVATVNGFIVQGANLGTVFGPPLFAGLVGILGGWDGTWVVLAAFGVAGVAATLGVRAAELKLQ